MRTRPLASGRGGANRSAQPLSETDRHATQISRINMFPGSKVYEKRRAAQYGRVSEAYQ